MAMGTLLKFTWRRKMRLLTGTGFSVFLQNVLEGVCCRFNYHGEPPAFIISIYLHYLLAV